VAAVGIRDLSRNTTKVVEEVEASRRPTLVTRHGRPVVAIIPVDEDALEDWLLSTAPEFVDAMDEADREYAAGETVDLDELVDELDGA
jgi:prevent-host-death family protein